MRKNNWAEYYALLGCATVILNMQVQTLWRDLPPEYMYHITQGHIFIFTAIEN